MRDATSGAGDKLVRLDALRGLAAAAVVANHVLLTFWPRAAGKADVWPWLRVLYDGGFAVKIFFVLSGFVLSVSFFRTGNVRVLWSAALRRYLRLCLPVAASVLLAYAILASGLMFNRACADAQLPAHFAWLKRPYAFAPSFSAALREGFYGAFFHFTPGYTYNPALWTMSIELRGSYVVFAFLALFGHLRYRWPFYLMAIALAYWLDFLMVLFIVGIWLSDVLIGRCDARPWPSAVCAALVLLGLMLGGLTPAWAANFGLGVSLSQTFSAKLIGAVLVVAGTAGASPWASRARVPLLAFLGRVSFSLYLVHLPLLLSVGCGTFVALAQRAGWSHTASAAAATAAAVTAMLMASWLGAMTVEHASIRLGRRLSDRVLQSARVRAGLRPARSLAEGGSRLGPESQIERQ